MKQYVILTDTSDNSTYGIVVKDEMTFSAYGAHRKAKEWADWANSQEHKSLEQLLPPSITESVGSSLHNDSSIFIKGLLDVAISRGSFVPGKRSYVESHRTNAWSATPSARDFELRAFSIDERQQAVAFKALAFKSDSSSYSFAALLRSGSVGFNPQTGLVRLRADNTSSRHLQAKVDVSIPRTIQRHVGIDDIAHKSLIKNRDIIGEQIEVKKLGSRLGSRLGGGLRAAPPGMVFIDVTGRIDADKDGIVFESTPMVRPIIPRFTVPESLGREISSLLQGSSEENEKLRRAGRLGDADVSGVRSQIEKLLGADAPQLNRTQSTRASATRQSITPERARAAIQRARQIGASRVGRGEKTQINTEGSRAVEKISWDDKAKELIVTFNGGRTYTYKDVDDKWVKELESNPEFLGRILNDIKKQGFQYERGGKHAPEKTLSSLAQRRRESVGLRSSQQRQRPEPRRAAGAGGDEPPTPPDDEKEPSGMRSSSARRLTGTTWDNKTPKDGTPTDDEPFQFDFSANDLSEIDLSGANLSNAELSGKNLAGAKLNDINGSRIDLTDADLTRANMDRSDMAGAEMAGANLEKASLIQTDLTGANLEGANLERADLLEARLENAYLREANLENAKLNAFLTDATLQGANLYGADMRDADLRGADLRDADLREADLTGANLDGAVLTGANLDGAKLDKGWEQRVSTRSSRTSKNNPLKQSEVDDLFYDDAVWSNEAIKFSATLDFQGYDIEGLNPLSEALYQTLPDRVNVDTGKAMNDRKRRYPEVNFDYSKMSDQELGDFTDIIAEHDSEVFDFIGELGNSTRSRTVRKPDAGGYPESRTVRDRATGRVLRGARDTRKRGPIVDKKKRPRTETLSGGTRYGGTRRGRYGADADIREGRSQRSTASSDNWDNWANSIEPTITNNPEIRDLLSTRDMGAGNYIRIGNDIVTSRDLKDIFGASSMRSASPYGGPVVSGVSLPTWDDLNKMRRIPGPTGLNEGYWYEDDSTGRIFFAKRGRSDGHAEAEVAGAAVYRVAGAGVPHKAIIKNKAGETWVVSEKIDNLQNTSNPTGRIRAQAKQDMGIDMLLQVRDAWSGGSNKMVDPIGIIHTVDTGGAGPYRAQGGAKTPEFSPNAEWTDVATMIYMPGAPIRGQHISNLYGRVSNNDLVVAMRRVEHLNLQKIDQEMIDTDVPPAMRKLFADTISARQKMAKTMADLFEGYEPDARVNVAGTDVTPGGEKVNRKKPQKLTSSIFRFRANDDGFRKDLFGPSNRSVIMTPLSRGDATKSRYSDTLDGEVVMRGKDSGGGLQVEIVRRPKGDYVIVGRERNARGKYETIGLGAGRQDDILDTADNIEGSFSSIDDAESAIREYVDGPDEMNYDDVLEYLRDKDDTKRMLGILATRSIADRNSGIKSARSASLAQRDGELRLARPADGFHYADYERMPDKQLLEEYFDALANRWDGLNSSNGPSNNSEFQHIVTALRDRNMFGSVKQVLDKYDMEYQAAIRSGIAFRIPDSEFGDDGSYNMPGKRPSLASLRSSRGEPFQMRLSPSEAESLSEDILDISESAFFSVNNFQNQARMERAFERISDGLRDIYEVDGKYDTDFSEDGIPSPQSIPPRSIDIAPEDRKNILSAIGDVRGMIASGAIKDDISEKLDRLEGRINELRRADNEPVEISMTLLQLGELSKDLHKIDDAIDDKLMSADAKFSAIGDVRGMIVGMPALYDALENAIGGVDSIVITREEFEAVAETITGLQTMLQNGKLSKRYAASLDRLNNLIDLVDDSDGHFVTAQLAERGHMFDMPRRDQSKFIRMFGKIAGRSKAKGLLRGRNSSSYLNMEKEDRVPTIRGNRIPEAAVIDGYKESNDYEDNFRRWARLTKITSAFAEEQGLGKGITPTRNSYESSPQFYVDVRSWDAIQVARMDSWQGLEGDNDGRGNLSLRSTRANLTSTRSKRITREGDPGVETRVPWLRRNKALDNGAIVDGFLNSEESNDYFNTWLDKVKNSEEFAEEQGIDLSVGELDFIDYASSPQFAVDVQDWDYKAVRPSARRKSRVINPFDGRPIPPVKNDEDDEFELGFSDGEQDDEYSPLSGDIMINNNRSISRSYESSDAFERGYNQFAMNANDMEFANEQGIPLRRMPNRNDYRYSKAFNMDAERHANGINPLLNRSNRSVSRSSEPGIGDDEIAGDMTLGEYGVLEEALDLVRRDGTFSDEENRALSSLSDALSDAILANDMIVLGRDDFTTAQSAIDKWMSDPENLPGGFVSDLQGVLGDMENEDADGNIWTSLILEEQGTRLSMEAPSSQTLGRVRSKLSKRSVSERKRIASIERGSSLRSGGRTAVKGLNTPGAKRIDEQDGQLWESLSPEQRGLVEARAIEVEENIIRGLSGPGSLRVDINQNGEITSIEVQDVTKERINPINSGGGANEYVGLYGDIPDFNFWGSTAQKEVAGKNKKQQTKFNELQKFELLSTERDSTTGMWRVVLSKKGLTRLTATHPKLRELLLEKRDAIEANPSLTPALKTTQLKDITEKIKALDDQASALMILASARINAENNLNEDGGNRIAFVAEQLPSSMRKELLGIPKFFGGSAAAKNKLFKKWAATQTSKSNKKLRANSKEYKDLKVKFDAGELPEVFAWYHEQDKNTSKSLAQLGLPGPEEFGWKRTAGDIGKIKGPDGNVNPNYNDVVGSSPIVDNNVNLDFDHSSRLWGQDVLGIPDQDATKIRGESFWRKLSLAKFARPDAQGWVVRHNQRLVKRQERKNRLNRLKAGQVSFGGRAEDVDKSAQELRILKKIKAKRLRALQAKKRMADEIYDTHASKEQSRPAIVIDENGNPLLSPQTLARIGDIEILTKSPKQGDLSKEDKQDAKARAKLEKEIKAGNLQADRVLGAIWGINGYNERPTIVTEEEFIELAQDSGATVIRRGHGGKTFAERHLDDPERYTTGDGGTVQGPGEYWSIRFEGGEIRPDSSWRGYIDADAQRGKKGTEPGPGGTVAILPANSKIIRANDLAKIKQDMNSVSGSIATALKDPSLPNDWRNTRTGTAAEQLAELIQDNLYRSVPDGDPRWETTGGKVILELVNAVRNASNPEERAKALDALRYFVQGTSGHLQNYLAPLLGYDAIRASSGVMLVMNRGALIEYGGVGGLSMTDGLERAVKNNSRLDPSIVKKINLGQRVD